MLSKPVGALPPTFLHSTLVRAHDVACRVSVARRDAALLHPEGSREREALLVEADATEEAAYAAARALDALARAA